MKKTADLSHYRNKKLLMNETKKLADYILEQAKQGAVIHAVEQGIWDKLLTMGEQDLGQFIAFQDDGNKGSDPFILKSNYYSRRCINGDDKNICSG